MPLPPQPNPTEGSQEIPKDDNSGNSSKGDEILARIEQECQIDTYRGVPIPFLEKRKVKICPSSSNAKDAGSEETLEEWGLRLKSFREILTDVKLDEEATYVIQHNIDHNQNLQGVVVGRNFIAEKSHGMIWDASIGITKILEPLDEAKIQTEINLQQSHVDQVNAETQNTLKNLDIVDAALGMVTRDYTPKEKNQMVLFLRNKIDAMMTKVGVFNTMDQSHSAQELVELVNLLKKGKRFA